MTGSSVSRRAVLTMAGASVLALNGRALAAGDDSKDQQAIGQFEDIVNVAWATPQGSKREEVEHEDPAFFQELVETENESAVVITFADGSKLTMGENAEVLIDEFVYDTSSKTGSQVVTLTKGAFRFVSGSLPKESVKLNTPTVTIGIRGTELTIDVFDGGQTESSTIEGEGLYTAKASGKELTLRPGQSCLLGPDGKWVDGVRPFLHAPRSIAIAEGLEGARKRWRIRKERRRRAGLRLRFRLGIGGGGRGNEPPPYRPQGPIGPIGPMGPMGPGR